MQPVMRAISYDRPDATLFGWEVGAGPTVVLLHAGGERSDVWRPVVQLLADRHRVRCVAFDQRGHGRSGGRGERLAQFGDDLAAVLAHEPRPCLVVGSSLGGMAAMDALRDPGARRAVAGLILVDVLPDPDPTRARQFLRDRGMMNAEPPLVSDILARSSDLYELLRASATPVWLVRATRSVLSDAEVRRLVATVPRVSVTTVDAGHLVARDAPTELAEVIGEAASGWLSLPAAP